MARNPHDVPVETRTRLTQQPAPVAAARPDEHLATTLWRGAFIHATCALCVWDGPGRRATASADRDAARHLRG